MAVIGLILSTAYLIFRAFYLLFVSAGRLAFDLILTLIALIPTRYSIGLAFGIGLIVAGPFIASQQDEFQTSVDVFWEAGFFTLIGRPVGSVLYTFLEVPYDWGASGINALLQFGAKQTVDFWNRIKAVASVTLSSSTRTQRPFSATAFTFGIADLLSFGVSEVLTTVDGLFQAIVAAFDYIYRDIILRSAAEVQEIRLPGFLGDFVEDIAEILICFYNFIREFFLTFLDFSFVSTECLQCEYISDRDCSLGRNVQIGDLVLEWQCPTTDPPFVPEDGCNILTTRLVRCIFGLYRRLIPLGVILSIIPGPVGTTIQDTYNEFFDNLEDAAVCIANLWQKPVFIFLSVSDWLIHELSGGATGRPCLNPFSEDLFEEILGYLILDDISILKCFNKLLQASTAGILGDFFDLVFQTLFSFFAEIIESFEKLWNCSVNNPEFYECVLSWPGGVLNDVVPIPQNGLGFCELTDNAFGIDLVNFNVLPSNGLHTCSLIATDCICEPAGDEELPNLLQGLCVPVPGLLGNFLGTDTLLGFLVGFPTWIVDAAACPGLLIADCILQTILATPDFVVAVFEKIVDIRTFNPLQVNQVLCNVINGLILQVNRIDDLITCIGDVGFLRILEVVWLPINEAVSWILEAVLSILNTIISPINAFLGGLRTICRDIVDIFDDLDNVFDEIGEAVPDCCPSINPFPQPNGDTYFICRPFDNLAFDTCSGGSELDPVNPPDVADFFGFKKRAEPGSGGEKEFFTSKDSESVEQGEVLEAAIAYMTKIHRVLDDYDNKYGEKTREIFNETVHERAFGAWRNKLAQHGINDTSEIECARVLYAKPPWEALSRKPVRPGSAEQDYLHCFIYYHLAKHWCDERELDKCMTFGTLFTKMLVYATGQWRGGGGGGAADGSTTSPRRYVNEHVERVFKQGKERLQKRIATLRRNSTASADTDANSGLNNTELATRLAEIAKRAATEPGVFMSQIRRNKENAERRARARNEAREARARAAEENKDLFGDVSVAHPKYPGMPHYSSVMKPMRAWAQVRDALIYAAYYVEQQHAGAAKELLSFGGARSTAERALLLRQLAKTFAWSMAARVARTRLYQRTVDVTSRLAELPTREELQQFALREDVQQALAVHGQPMLAYMKFSHMREVAIEQIVLGVYNEEQILAELDTRMRAVKEATPTLRGLRPGQPVRAPAESFSRWNRTYTTQRAADAVIAQHQRVHTGVRRSFAQHWSLQTQHSEDGTENAIYHMVSVARGEHQVVSRSPRVMTLEQMRAKHVQTVQAIHAVTRPMRHAGPVLYQTTKRLAEAAGLQHLPAVQFGAAALDAAMRGRAEQTTQLSCIARGDCGYDVQNARVIPPEEYRSYFARMPREERGLLIELFRRGYTGNVPTKDMDALRAELERERKFNEKPLFLRAMLAFGPHLVPYNETVLEQTGEYVPSTGRSGSTLVRRVQGAVLYAREKRALNMTHPRKATAERFVRANTLGRFNANQIFLDDIIAPLVQFVFGVSAQEVIDYFRSLPSRFSGDSIENFFLGIIFDDIPAWFFRVVNCALPENIDGTLPYSPFCVLLPEAALAFLDPPPPNSIVPLQVGWPDVLVRRDCVKIPVAPDGADLRDGDLVFLYRQQQQCGRVEETTDFEPCVLGVCASLGCNPAVPSTLNNRDVYEALRQCCEARPDCETLAPACGFGIINKTSTTTGLGFVCNPANANPVCIESCCELGAQTCDTGDLDTLLSAEANECLRFCCNGEAPTGGLCPPGGCAVPAGGCLNFCIDEYEYDGMGGIVARKCDLFPYCDDGYVSDYCRRLYENCRDIGFSDFLDVLLYVTGSFPFAVDFLVRGVVSSTFILDVFAIVWLVVAIFISYPTVLGPATIYFLAYFQTAVIVWFIAATLNLPNLALPFGFVVTVGYVFIFLGPFKGYLKALGLPFFTLLQLYTAVWFVFVLFPVPDIIPLLNINGVLLRIARALADDVTIVARIIPGVVDGLVARLEQFDYVALGGVPSFHNICVFLVPESWGYALLLYFGRPFWRAIANFLSAVLAALAAIGLAIVIFVRSLYAELTANEVEDIEQQRMMQQRRIRDQLKALQRRQLGQAPAGGAASAARS